MIMTTITFPSRVQQNSSIFENLRDGLVAFGEGVKEGLDMAHAYNRLSRMSGDELLKRGLTRSDVSRAVVKGRTSV
jgi:hypothetical protein